MALTLDALLLGWTFLAIFFSFAIGQKCSGCVFLAYASGSQTAPRLTRQVPK